MKNYSKIINSSINQLFSLLKMNLRTEKLNDNQIIKKLNNKIEFFIKKIEEVKLIFEEFQEDKNLISSMSKNIKDQEIIIKQQQEKYTQQKLILSDIDKKKNDLIEIINILEKENEEKSEEILNFKILIEKNEEKYIFEVNKNIKLQNEKEYYKTQNQNLNTLTKQILQEKKKDEYYNFEKEIELIKSKVEKYQIKDSQKLSMKDAEIESLQRNCSLLEKQLKIQNDMELLDSLNKNSKF